MLATVTSTTNTEAFQSTVNTTIASLPTYASSALLTPAVEADLQGLGEVEIVGSNTVEATYVLLA